MNITSSYGEIVLKHLVLMVVIISASSIAATPGAGQSDLASRNVELVSHVEWSDAGSDFSGPRYLAFETNRPRLYATSSTSVDVFSIETDELSRLGTIELELDTREASNDIKAFRVNGKDYLAVAFMAREGGGSGGFIVYDTSGDKADEVIRVSTNDNGLINLFVYRHSDGRTLLFGAGDSDLFVYDLAMLLNGEIDPIRKIPSPDQVEPDLKGFHDVFVGYHPDTAQDRLYTAGAGGYYVYDITDPLADSLLVAINPAGIKYGHKVAAEPRGNVVVTAPNYRLAPVRLYDLRPVFEGVVPRLRVATGAWATGWCNYVQHLEVRWPYVFVAAMDDGFQMFNMRDLDEVYTYAYYRTSGGSSDCDPNAPAQGAFDIEVRNSDGLIAVSDLQTGLWVFKIESFDGWDGRGWGVPNVSSVQDWEGGPVGQYR